MYQISYEREKNSLRVYIEGELNYPKVRFLETILKKEKDISEIHIFLTCGKFIDTEGIKFLYRLKKEGIGISIYSDRSFFKLFDKELDILSLEELKKFIKKGVLNG